MAECNLSGDKLVCEDCGRDTFAVRRENGLEVKYRDRWILILNGAVGTVLFRCRLCNSVTVYDLGADGESTIHRLEFEDSADRGSLSKSQCATLKGKSRKGKLC